MRPSGRSLRGSATASAPSEVKSLEEAYRGEADACLRQLGTKRTQRFKLRLGKALIGLFAVLLPPLAASLTGLLTSSATHGLMAFLFLCAIVFWRKG